MRVPNGNSSNNGRFVFSSPSNEFVNNFINVSNEDVLYNWTDKASISISKVGIPFNDVKEMHLATI